MREFVRTYFTSTAIFYTIIVLTTAAINMAGGYERISNISLLEMFIYLILCDIADYFFRYISFRKSWHYSIAYAAAIYALLLAFGYPCGWFEFSVKGLLEITVIFALIYCMIKGYYAIIETKEADEINEMLNKKGE